MSLRLLQLYHWMVPCFHFRLLLMEVLRFSSVCPVLTADTGKYFTVSAICQSYSVSSPEGSAVDEITFTFKCTGSVTPGWS